MPIPDIRTPLPGPRAQQIIDRDKASVSPSYTRSYPFVMARGEGAVAEDVDGNRFLDCSAGIAVTSTGHSHPDVVRAIVQQAGKFLHMSGTDFYYEDQVELAERFGDVAPMKGPVRSFFSNSGAEANEAAVKLARYHTKRQYIIAFLGAFHGRTMGALAMTASKAVQRRGFGPLMPGVYHAPFADCYRCPLGLKPESCGAECLNFIEDQLLVHLVSPDEVAAVMVEPIQGEGGYVVPPTVFMERLRSLTKTHGILLIADEVQSGMGRSGKMFAIEHFGVEPDIVSVAKGIASGMPLGITASRAEVMDWPPGAHASTFGGNPVSCAAALAVIDTIESENLLDHVDRLGTTWRGELSAVRSPLLHGVRGRGLWLALVTQDGAAPAIEIAARAHGFLVNATGPDAVRIAPPLVLSEEQAAMFTAALPAILAAAETTRLSA
jgi:4-aminobutyrate aminotransferase